MIAQNSICMSSQINTLDAAQKLFCLSSQLILRITILTVYPFFKVLSPFFFSITFSTLFRLFASSSEDTTEMHLVIMPLFFEFKEYSLHRNLLFCLYSQINLSFSQITSCENRIPFSSKISCINNFPLICLPICHLVRIMSTCSLKKYFCWYQSLKKSILQTPFASVGTQHGRNICVGCKEQY